MDAQYTDYRLKWRQRRQQMRLRRLPLIIGGVLLLVAVVVLSAREHRPQLGAVVWVQGDGSRGMPRIGMGQGAVVIVWEYGTVMAQSAATGAPTWPVPFERAHPFEGPPGIGSGRVVVGGSDGHVWCLELGTGSLEWGFYVQTLARSRPLILQDRVYIGADDGRLYCLRLSDGTLVWAYPPPDQADREPILGGPAISGDTLVCGSCERDAYGLDLATGALRWRMEFDGPVIAQVTTDAQRAYVAVESGLVICVSAPDGKPIWQRTLPSLVREPVVVRAGRALLVTTDGSVRCVDAQTGQDLWSARLHGRPTTQAVADDERLYVGTSDRLVEALSLETGKMVWHWRPGAKPLSDLLLDAQHLYCSVNSGRVFAVRTR